MGLENAIDAGGAASDDVGVEHHECQSTITLEGMGASKSTDALFLVVGEPVVAWDPGVVFVDLAEAMLPVVEFTGANADPGKKATDGDLRLVAPDANEIDEVVAGVVRHPATL